MSTSARLGVVGLMLMAICVARLIEVELAAPRLRVQVVRPPSLEIVAAPEESLGAPEIAQEVASAPAPVKQVGRRYTVQSGDTLGTIARKVYGTSRLWKQIHQANLDLIPNPKRMKLGVELRIPPRDVGGAQ